MPEYDLYLNVRKPSLVLYVRRGAGYPDLADKDDWVFDGFALQELVPREAVQGIETHGHAFVPMD